MTYTNEKQKPQRLPWPEADAMMNPGTDNPRGRAVDCQNRARKYLWDWSRDAGRPIVVDGFDDMDEHEFQYILSDIEESIDNVVNLHALMIKFVARRVDYTTEAL